jgi:V8-like Glu-specific endopeptidase
MYYNGSAPYGSAWGTLTYYKYKVAGPTIDSTEIQYDYVVIVLDRPIGNSTGWLGAKSYSDSWDGGAYWTHAGYPGDLTGTQRPTYQTGIALDGDFWSADDNESMTHKADIWPGQSGGPFWGYWDGAPYAVATQSAHNPSENFASGGSDLVNLVIRARNEHP